MIVFVHSDDVFNYFENIVCPVRANNLHPYSIAVALCYIAHFLKNIHGITNVFAFSVEFINC